MNHPLSLDGGRGTRSTYRVTNEADRPEFDETAVLEELERLRGAIRLARSKRAEKVAEFETFVRDARMAARQDALRATGVEPDDDEVQTEQLHPPHVPEQPEFGPATVPPWSPPPSAQFETPSAPGRLSRLDDMSEATAAFPDVPHHRTRDTYIIAGAAGVLILVLALLSWIGGDSAAPASPATPGRSTPASSSPGAPAATNPATTGQPSQAGESSATPTAPLPLQVELVALRKVWMRVTVDGDRAIEQELEEGQRLRFGAKKAIVVRAGDAGAVTISIDGQEAAPLGRAGQAATRTVVPRPK
jgi:RodZ C-terminal domain